VTKGMLGGGFLYTNKDSLSLGVVVGMKAMTERGEQVGAEQMFKSYELLDEFKALPQVAPLVKGGNPVEYSAHAIPEGGIAKVPKLVGDGYLIVGDAGGLALNALYTVRGMDFAIASGYYAARAIADAKKRGDLSVVGLAQYEHSLRSSFVLKDLETAREIPHIIENPRIFTHYPVAVSRLLESVFTLGPEPTPKLVMGKVWRGVRKDFLNVATVKDMLSFRKM